METDREGRRKSKIEKKRHRESKGGRERKGREVKGQVTTFLPFLLLLPPRRKWRHEGPSSRPVVPSTLSRESGMTFREVDLCDPGFRYGPSSDCRSIGGRNGRWTWTCHRSGLKCGRNFAVVIQDNSFHHWDTEEWYRNGDRCTSEYFHQEGDMTVKTRGRYR